MRIVGSWPSRGIDGDQIAVARKSELPFVRVLPMSNWHSPCSWVNALVRATIRTSGMMARVRRLDGVGLAPVGQVHLNCRVPAAVVGVQGIRILPAVGWAPSLSSRQSPYKALDLASLSPGEVYTQAVIHDTIGRRISPSLFKGPLAPSTLPPNDRQPALVQAYGGLLVLQGESR